MTSKAIVPKALNNKSLAEAAVSVASIDADLERILADHGTPPLWARKPGFVTLVRIILEQQVSLASGEAMYRRLLDHIVPLTPPAVLAAEAPFLRSFGVTRQKAAYVINVAEEITNGELDMDELAQESDESVIERLTSIVGIGPWRGCQYSGAYHGSGPPPL